MLYGTIEGCQDLLRGERSLAIDTALVALQVAIEEAKAEAGNDAHTDYDDVSYEACEEGYIHRCQVESVVIIAFMTADLVLLNDLHGEAVAMNLAITLAWLDKLRRDSNVLQILLFLKRVFF